jgi:purine nucleosidase
MPEPLILDVDTGIDDALALLYAAASPEVELLAVTCVMGNVTVDDAVENTKTVLDLAGLPSTEVCRGAARPWAREFQASSGVHGARGLGRADPSPSSGATSSRDAADAILEVARSSPGDVLLVATGPLTNVATALKREPDLPHLLKRIVLMGGAFACGGNTTPAAEANIWVDPHSAAAVFQAFTGWEASRLPLCVGLDVTEQVRLSRDDLDRIKGAAPSSPLAAFLDELVLHYIEVHERGGVLGGAYLHDPLALGIAIDPALAKLESTRVEVETEGRWTLGETVADLLGVRRSPWPVGWGSADNARVALDVDAGAFVERFIDRLVSLVGSGSTRYP